MRTIFIDGEYLALEDVLDVAEGRARVRISASVSEKVKRARDFVE